MKLIVTEKNYAATVVKLTNIRKHSNADQLQVATVFGNNVIVGMDAKEGDVVVYFPLESKLGSEYLKLNDLVRRKDDQGNPCGGFFEENGRVKCLKLRGEKSEGFVMPMNSLPFDMKIGDEFNSIEHNGKIYEICTKYKRPLTVREQKELRLQKGRKPRVSRLVDNQFRLHFDTEQLGKNAHKFNPNTLISVTRKMHGTSFVVGNVLVNRPLRWYEKLLMKIGIPIGDREYDTVYSSRTVIKNQWFDTQNPNGYYGEDLWGHIAKKFKGLLLEGETVYGEAVGFLPESGRAIQQGYDYGCLPNTYKIYIYRITMTNPSGHVFEYSWPQITDRCKEIGMEHVPYIYYGSVIDYVGQPDESTVHNYQEKFVSVIRDFVEHMGQAQLCVNKVPEEGVVVRIEGRRVESFKCKSFAFLGMETKLLDDPNASDVESEQTVVEA